MFGRFSFASIIAVLSLTVLGRAEFSFTTRNFRLGGAALRAVAGGGERLVAVGTSGRTLTSTNGHTWIAAAPVTADSLNGITFGSGRYVAVGDSGRVLVSTDGERWSSSAVSDGQRLNAITHGNGVFVAVGDAGRIFTSEDGRVWVRRAVDVISHLRGIGFEPANGFVAGGDFSSGARSIDAANWVRGLPLSLAFTGSFQAAVGNRALGQVAVLTDSGSLLRATTVDEMSAAGGVETGFRYTESVARVPDARFRGIVAGGRSVLAVGDGGLICHIAEFLSQPWPVVRSNTTSDLRAGTFHDGAFYVVGGNEVILQSAPIVEGRLMNISTRGVVAGQDRVMVSGVVVSGTAPKRVLLRAVGPTLADLGVSTPLALPQITVFDASGAIIATAAAWSGSPDAAALREAASRVGAFALKEGSADSALLRTLSPGNYTVQVSGRTAAAGVALIEAYDLDAVTTGPRLVNLSTRGTVGTGENVMIAGFSVGGDTPMKLLIRAVGPSLARFGVTDTIALPTMGLSDGRSGPVYPGGFWSTSGPGELRAAAVRAGAFPLDEGSRDSAWIRTVPPGNWFVQFFGSANTQGAGLVEVYEVP